MLLLLGTFPRGQLGVMVKSIYVFGNEYLAEDSFARKISERLAKNFHIIHSRSPDDLLDAAEDEIIILDVVKGIDEPVVITDIKQLKTRNIVSLHDFDLGFFLNLLKELGMDKKFKIIGIPQKGDMADIAKRVRSYV